MIDARLATEAEIAGYVVFKMGAAGALIGLAVGLMAGGGPALETWLAASLSVSAAGGLLGSLARLSQTRAARTDIRAAANAPQAVATPLASRPAQSERPRVSAFRTQSRPAR